MAAGDVVVLIALLTFGVVSHNGTAILTSAPDYVATTIVPFLVGWAIFAPLVGAYSPGAVESAKAAIPLAIRSWLPADLVGIGVWYVIRGTDVVGVVVFALVTILIGAVGLAVWRWVYHKAT